jgi:hypothetical protein
MHAKSVRASFRSAILVHQPTGAERQRRYMARLKAAAKEKARAPAFAGTGSAEPGHTIKVQHLGAGCAGSSARTPRGACATREAGTPLDELAKQYEPEGFALPMTVFVLDQRNEALAAVIKSWNKPLQFD